MYENSEFLIGKHTIVHALKNKKRKVIKLIGVKDSISEIQKEIICSEYVETCSSNVFEKKFLEISRLQMERTHKLSFKVILEVEKINDVTLPHLYSLFDKGKDNFPNVLCLDQITDMHNAGAIIRTAAFYGVEYVILPNQNSFKKSMFFYKNTCGACEYVNLIQVNSLTRTIKKLREKGITVIGLSEDGEGSIKDNLLKESKVLVIGSEGKGLSNAVKRNLDMALALKGKGKISTLNASVAAAIGMSLVF